MNSVGNMRGFFSLLMVWLWTAAATAAQMDAALAPSTAHIGDTLRLTVRVTGAGGRPLRFGRPDDENFSLLRVDSSRLAAAGEMGFTLAVYDTGEYTLPQFPVIVGTAADAETLFTPLQSVTIASVLPDSAQSPLPLKPYREHPFQWRELLAWWWIPALAALVSCAVWFWRWRSRRRLRKEMGYEEPLPPPEEEAIRLLIRLRDEKYPARGMLKEFFSEYSYILRRYLERRYEFPALEMTTYELERRFENGTVPIEWPTRLLPVLREADLVKFAKYLPDYSRCDAHLELGFELIELSRAPLTTETEEAAAA
ncbi:MAG: hypothetical protein PHI18_00305 [bacterium]|nr:hypothetical protein [bacterium]